jgi:hypothetical protein
MLHVGMNIADKARLFAGIRRVLKPGARFGIYDVMREGAGDLPFPMPWASGAATSFIEPAAVYTALLADAGFALDGERNRRAFALETFAEMRARGRHGASPLGQHLVMGPQAAQKVANMISAVEQGLIAPVEIIARAV